MTKDEQFDGLRRVRPRELCQPPEHLDHGQVQHPHHHDEIMAEIDESPAHTACDGYWHRTGSAQVPQLRYRVLRSSPGVAQGVSRLWSWWRFGTRAVSRRPAPPRARSA